MAKWQLPSLKNPFRAKPATELAAAPRRIDGLGHELAVSQAREFMLRVPDVDEMLRRAGLSRADLRVLEYDDEVAQCLDTRREAVIATPWRLEPNTTRANKALAAMLKPWMEPLLHSALDAVFYGYSVVEVVYGADAAGRIGIAKLEEKPREWFVRDKAGWLYHDEMGRYWPIADLSKAQENFVATMGHKEAPIDHRKFLITVRQPSYRQPYGEALLSRCWWPVFFKKNSRQFWARFLERFGEPLLVGQVADQRKFTDDIIRLGVAAGLPVQPGDNVQAVMASQTGEFERFENVLSRSIQKLILGQTLTSDVGKSGSYAAAQVHDGIREQVRCADIRLVSSTVQSLVNYLAELNGWDAPRFVMADDSGLELERAQRDVLMWNTGLIKPTAEYLMDRYDFNDGDFILVDQATVPADQPDNPQLSVQPMIQLSAGDKPFTPDQQAIEDLADAALSRVESPVPPLLIAAAIRAATDPQDLEDRLSVLMRSDSHEFTQTLERAMFAADVMGYAHAQ